MLEKRNCLSARGCLNCHYNGHISKLYGLYGYSEDLKFPELKAPRDYRDCGQKAF